MMDGQPRAEECAAEKRASRLWRGHSARMREYHWMTRRYLRFNAVRIDQKIEDRRAQALAKADGLILAATRGAPSRLLQKMPLCRRAPTSEVRIDRGLADGGAL